MADPIRLASRLTPPVRWRRGELSGRCLPGYEGLDPESLPWQAVLDRKPLPDDVVRAKRSPNRIVLSTVVNGERLYFKRAEPKNRARHLSEIIQGPKTRREWNVLREFRARGVFVPEPVLEASARAGRVSFLVTRGLPESWIPAADYLQAYGAETPLLESIGRLTRWLHDRELYHHDWRTDHIYLTDAGEEEPVGERFALIDLDGAFAGKEPSAKLRREAMWELFISLHRCEFDRDQARAILGAYDREGRHGFDAGALWQETRTHYLEAKEARRQARELKRAAAGQKRAS